MHSNISRTARERSLMARATAVKMPPEASAVHGCEGARRVLALMLAFSTDRNTLTARDLAAATGIALPSVYRYITLLRETGLLAGDERGSYRLSARLIGLARAAEAAESIIDIADPVMRELAAQTGETVILVRLIGRSAVCVHRVQSAQRLRISFEAGQPLPLERGASARLLLSGLPPEQRREYLAPLAERDPEAAARFEIKAAQAAQQGYATSEEELETGVFAVSAPVFQGKRMIAVITVPSPLVRAPAPLQEKLLSQVRAAAQDLNEALRVTRRLPATHAALTTPGSHRYPSGMPDFREVIPGTRASAGHASLAELQAAMAAGELTSAELTSFYLQRIDRLNPALHAVSTVNLNAGYEAAASDKARARSGPRGSLDGIPVLVKDNVQVAGMPTTAGSPALLPADPPDAFLVTKLREAGAVIIGKANLSEWANFRSTHSTSGWSTLGGQTANPYALDRNPSGSSSGSAAGVAAALAPVAVGTETDGSIVCPASACGIVGLKPTNGLVSRRGIVPISPVQDTAGPMATCVADAAALLSVLAAADPEDPVAPGDNNLAERTIRTVGPSSFTQALDPAALDGARLGIWRDPSAPAGAATGAVLDMSVARLRALGAVVADPVTLPDAAKINEPEFTALRYEFKYGINAYLAYVGGFGFGDTLPRTLAELIDVREVGVDPVLELVPQ